MRTIFKGDVKNIPAKYKVLENIEDYIDDLHSPRLSKTERENLDLLLLRHKLSEVIDQAHRTPGIRDIVNVAEPLMAVKVHTRNEVYYTIRFANGKEIHCPASAYKASPVKETINRLY